MRNWLSALALALIPVLNATGAKAERDAARVYVFGNSLVNHLSETSDVTNVPHWLNEMAKADNRSLALDGQWGFLRNFVTGLPPTANWGFPGVSGAWSPAQGGFRDGRFDSVIVAPGNFIQYQLPDVPYEGANPGRESPLGALQKLLDWVVANSPDSRLFIYEGWSAMDGIVAEFPPTVAETEAFYAYNAGDYHQWYREVLNVLRVTRPDSQIDLIPVGSVMAELFAKGGVLENISPQSLYTDTAPHGTPTVYMLAAMITYPWIYGAPLPVDYTPPATLHPDLVENYAAVAKVIWEAVPQQLKQAAQDPAPELRAPDPLPKRQAVALPPSGLRPEGLPALGMGLNGISDWSTQHPFLDLMKSSRGWVGNIGDAWGAVRTEDLRAQGVLDENGWPLRIPEGVDVLETVLLTNQPSDAASLRGDYVLTYEGSGDIRLMGRARRVRAEDGRIAFSYAPGEGLVALGLTRIDPDDPIRNIAIVRREHEALYRAGALFNPDFLARIEDLRVLRFMDWMVTNGSPVTGWDVRPELDSATWSNTGVPVEAMIRLANLVGADPWFNMPHLADDDYVRRFAEIVHRDLDPGLKAYVELSNEVWNLGFPQATWARQQAQDLWGADGDDWPQAYGLRAAQVMDIWTEVFGEDAERLIRVVGTQTGWPGLEENILTAPLAYLSLGYMPVDSFDAYAVTGYFGYELGSDEMADRIDGWLEASAEMARAAGEAEGLKRVALREYVKERRFEGAIAPVARALEQGSVRQVVKEVFPYHAGVARKHGLRLVMYEGGTHLVGLGTRVNDERLTAFFNEFSYTPEMAKLYEQLLTGWTDAGGVLFNAFVDVAPATMWGSWGAKRYLEDDNPRWDMLMAFNASGPNGWEPRETQVFENGIRVLDGSGRIDGTPQEDYLMAGPGDDVLISRGGADVLVGGAGRDIARLPGARNDYVLAREAGRIMATGPEGTLRLTGIEALIFEDAPEVEILTEGL